MDTTILHVYNRGNHKGPISFRKEDLFVLKKMFFKHLQPRYFDIISLCIMPNHYHLLIAYQCSKMLSTSMMDIGRNYTVYMNKKYGLVGHLFQGPYRRKIVKNYIYYRVLVEYIKGNPQKLSQIGGGMFLLKENTKLIEYYNLLLSEKYPITLLKFD